MRKVTQADIARAAGVSRKTITKHKKKMLKEMRADGISPSSTDDLNRALLERIKDAPKRDHNNTPSSNKERKTLYEAELLKLKLKERNKELLGQDDYMHGMSMLADIYASTFTEFIQWCTVMFPQGDVAIKLKDLENRARKKTRTLIDEAVRNAQAVDPDVAGQDE